jgi:hypothetical protein
MSPLDFLESVLDQYTAPNKYNILREAKEKYFKITGEITSEDDIYEAKMKMLNDWFLFNYQIKGKTPIQAYLTKNKVGPDLINMCHSINYSIFRYLGKNLCKKFVLYDLVADRKIYFATDDFFPSFLKNDLFVGRIATFKQVSFLLRGILIIPSLAYPIIKRQSKKIRKDISRKNDYILEIERKRTKMINYKHVPIKDIFQ